MAAAQTVNVRARITQAVDVENLVTLRRNTHPLARPEYDRGAAPDSLPMRRMLLVLQRGPEQEAALRQLLDEQQVKSSPNYHKWLTPEQFGEQFGPADADIQALTDWLATQGFEVNRVAAGRTVIEFSGTAGQVRQAFHTEIHKFVVKGEERWANASDPQIPTALAPVLAGIASLNNFPRKPLYHRLGTFSRSLATHEVRPLFTYTDNTGTWYAVGPGDFATIYNVQPLWQAGTDGTGQTIAVVGQSDINPQDVQAFRTMFGLPTSGTYLQITYNGPTPGVLAALGDESEADLDTEWAGAIAKGATVNFVVSEGTESTAGVDLSALYIIDNNLAPVLSESYGLCEASLGAGGNAFYSALWEQGAAQGITIVQATGDSGSAGCDNPISETAAQFGLAVGGNASTPFNIAIGGTDFQNGNPPSPYWSTTNSSPLQSSAKSYIPETTWNDSCASTGQASNCTSVASSGVDLAAGTGGPSAVYAKPSWQTGTGVPNDGARDTPDVSLFAGAGATGSFYVFCQMDANTGSTSSCDLNAPYQDFQGGGGASFAAPAFAGIMALVNQAQRSLQNPDGRQGNANYVLYPLAAQSGASCASNAAAVGTSSCIFYDVVTGNISVACVHGSLNCSNQTSSGYGIMVVNPSSNPQVPAWNTTAGYDLATGLGSVNVANLVNNWTSVSFAPTTTTLSLSPTSIAHGSAVTVDIAVAPVSGSGTPAGDVSLIAQTTSSGGLSTTTGVGGYTLANRVASGTTNLLPGGTYNVTAHYAGDGTYGASDSSPVSVTVSSESSKTYISLLTFDPVTGVETNPNATTAAYGSPYVLRVDVTNSSGQPCSSNAVPCPTGQVKLTDNGPPLDLGTYTLNSAGYLEDQPIQLTAGPHNVVASYQGDNSYNASTSPTDAIAIAQAATSTSVTASQSGLNTTLTAVVNTLSNGAAPTGTVQFLNAGNAIGGAVSCSGTAYSMSTGAFATCQATLTTSLSATATITAQYSGDTNYVGSTSTPITVTVTPDFSLSANPTSISISAPGQSGTSTITVTSGNGFTGAVAFSCAVPAMMSGGRCALNPSSLTTSGNTTLTVTTTAASVTGPGAGPFNSPGWFVAALGAILACIFLLVIPTRRRRPKMAFGLLVFALLVAAFVACGGGSSSTPSVPSNPGTPAGTYTVTVTATSGSLSHTVNVSVTVL
jgi:hypothetical protein